MKDFPINVFPDVERNAFKKYSKKNVTEDYIKENLRRKGWNCYSPFTDTGLDILATKEVNGQLIYRYIQVKTRSLDNGKFGYTLKSKDFETECRKFFFLYCDTVDDVIIISMYDYLKLCDENYGMGVGHFGGPSFRNNNNKLNNLTCQLSEDGISENKWTWSYRAKDNYAGGTIDFSEYLNASGLSKMDNPELDNRTAELNEEIANLKFKLFYRFSQTPVCRELFLDGVNTGEIVHNFVIERIDMEERDYIEEISTVEDNLKNNHSELYASHRRYLIENMLNGGNDE